MMEIGGYFGLEKFRGNEYYEDLIAVNTGRNALAYLLKIRNIKKLYIPRFLCDSVSGVCAREGCPVEYYAVGPDFLPRFDSKLEEGHWLYVVNFYGQISNDQATAMKAKWDRIIFDNVHAFFQRPVPGIDTIYSCRKFFGVPDGAYVSTDSGTGILIEPDVSKDRMGHVLGRYEGTASDYYAGFKSNDRSFVELPLRAMSELTHNLLRAIDYGYARGKRNENYAILEKHLGCGNGLRLTAPDGPYAYPFYCKNGMEVKKKLAQQNIYVATLWPNVLEGGSLQEKDYAENILPLPCDQRYGREEMERVIREVCACIG